MNLAENRAILDIPNEYEHIAQYNFAIEIESYCKEF